jgi:hypothetical protein
VAIVLVQMIINVAAWIINNLVGLQEWLRVRRGTAEEKQQKSRAKILYLLYSRTLEKE